MLSLRSQQQEFMFLAGQHNKMLTVAPTSAGKSIMMIADAQRQLQNNPDSTIVVVAPKILLAQQLSDEFEKFISNTNIIHMHSGDTEHTRITDFLELAYYWETTPGSKAIFTTYHSLHKIVQSEIDVDVTYLDEAHNATNRHFFDAVKEISQTSKRFYSMTATPKFSQSSRPGNNDSEVFGSKIFSVKAPDLIQNGSILEPKVSVVQVSAAREKDNAAERDFYTLCDSILNEEDMNKVLVVAPNTKVLNQMLSTTALIPEMWNNGYDVLWITSKHGAFVNGKKVCRSEFLHTLSEYGADPSRKFVVFHIGILTEGISVPGIQSCIFMRNQNVVSTVQSIGRCIRVNPEDTERMKNGDLTPGDFENYIKPFGKVVIPVYSNKVGIATARRVENVINEVFVKGNFVADYVK
jgi:late competence protein required for DNA uptake (superfamily II DNA/RNA helicase)